MAGIFKRGNVYWATWYDDTGNKVRKTTRIKVTPKKGFGTPTEARKQAQVVADRMEALAKGKTTLRDAMKALQAIIPDSSTSVPTAADYLEEWARKRTNNARNRDGKAIERFLASLPSPKMPLDRITKAHAEDFKNEELNRVSAGTVDRYLASLSKAFNRAVDEELIEKNPFRGVRLTKAQLNDKAHKEPFTYEEINIMLTKFPEEWRDMVLCTMLTGGQRLGDIVILSWNQVDLELNRISFKSKKTNRYSSKPIIPALNEMLSRRKATYSPVSDYVFPVAQSVYTSNGETVSNLSTQFVKLCVKHGIITRSEAMKQADTDKRNLSPKTFHSLRHSAVSFLRNAGVPADLCRLLVGHDSEAIEREYYHATEEEQKTALEKLHHSIGR